MDKRHLAAMVEDIASFFRSASVSDQISADIGSHLRRFWEPRMRSELIAAWRSGEIKLSDAAAAAVARLAETHDACG
ncbi:MAG: formate dehydrogenase subunit delta [Steroidobacteraceae bacterium]